MDAEILERAKRRPEAKQSASSSLWTLLACFGLLAAAGGACYWKWNASPVARPAAASLDLHVERTFGEMALRWNRDALPAGEILKGALIVKDGESVEEIELTAAQILDGFVVYAPMTEDVGFRMHIVFRDGRAMDESVRTLTRLGRLGGPRVPPSFPSGPASAGLH